MLFLYSCSAWGQNYFVSFSGTGESSSVAGIKVENLSSGEKRTLNGGDILHLTAPTAINEQYSGTSGKLKFYPNPMNEYSVMSFNSPVSGEVSVTVFDLTGRLISVKTLQLEADHQEFLFSGLEKGIYAVNVKGRGFSLSGKLSSISGSRSKLRIEKGGGSGLMKDRESTVSDSKASYATVDMPYNDGEVLKFVGTSGDFSTVVTSSFTGNKEIIFKFVRCTDADNRNYAVVEIGTQTWMASNLRTTKYMNGDLIGTTSPKTLNISAETSPKYEWVYYAFGITEIDTSLFGRLYTWHAAVDTRKVCPTGWHLPSQPEWNTLIASMGGSTVAGGKLKETGLSNWSSPNTGASNISGFSAVPGGTRAPAGSCTNYKNFCYLWSATQRDATYAWYTAMGYNFEMAYSDVNTLKSVGNGIRCVKD
jgi:uncharacterized protein (TIGR02145 family)